MIDMGYDKREVKLSIICYAKILIQASSIGLTELPKIVSSANPLPASLDPTEMPFKGSSVTVFFLFF